jgi:2-polyprenyl-3-methyl-5-hydroxy-6-metoxy-1,4-benzoquinol methylase
MNHYDISPLFLDVGCGAGDISRYAASKGWHGKAIDFSDIAIQKAKHNLNSFTSVTIEKKSLFEESESYRTIFLFDVLEHIRNDDEALH